MVKRKHLTLFFDYLFPFPDLLPTFLHIYCNFYTFGDGCAYVCIIARLLLKKKKRSQMETQFEYYSPVYLSIIYTIIKLMNRLLTTECVLWMQLTVVAICKVLESQSSWMYYNGLSACFVPL